jgi:hypothetical protein
MTSHFAMSAMSTAEFLLWCMLAFLFWKKQLYRRFPAMAAYLALHAVSTPFLLSLLYIQNRPWGPSSFLLYFCGYWTLYLAGAVLLIFICLEIFRSALASFPGLMRVGIVIFRWAILVSLIVTFSSLSFSFGKRGIMLLPQIATPLMRSVSLLELGMLAFLCLSMNALRLPLRDITFGIALGFGVMVSNEFVIAVIFPFLRSSSLTTPLEFTYEAFILVALAIWAVYCALPQRSAKPVVMPASSAIYRWNEIASALGHTGTHIAVQQPANGFFLTDVEKVVEKVITRNLKGRESEL